MKPDTPFVSVVIPVLNRKDWVFQLLASLAAQTYPRDRYETIVVDNGSTDGTWEALTLAAAQDPGLRCFRNESPRKIPAASRNLGIAHARGEIVAFTDSDCRATPEWLERGVAAFCDGVAVVVGTTLPDPEDPRPALFKTRQIEAGESAFDTCNIFYRMAAVKQAGGFSEDFVTFFPGMAALDRVGGELLYFGDDTDLACRVKRLGFRSAFAGKAVVFHHIRPQTLREWLAEPLCAVTFPWIFRKYPEMRKDALYLRYFLSPVTALFDAAVLGVLLAFLAHPVCLLLTVPFFTAKWRQGGGHLSLGMRVVRLAGASARALIIFAVLAYGSFRFRTLLI